MVEQDDLRALAARRRWPQPSRAPGRPLVCAALISVKPASTRAASPPLSTVWLFATIFRPSSPKRATRHRLDKKGASARQPRLRSFF